MLHCKIRTSKSRRFLRIYVVRRNKTVIEETS